MIEFSFECNDVNEAALYGFAFMVDFDDATKKRVIMTPENGPESPIFSYDSSENHPRWTSPGGAAGDPRAAYKGVRGLSFLFAGSTWSQNPNVAAAQRAGATRDDGIAREHSVRGVATRAT